MRFYMDYNASAPIYDDAFNMMMDVQKYVGNPSSIHASGRKVKSIIEDARDNIGNLLDCNSQDIVFTSGATEANTLVSNFTMNHNVIISAIEHPSILNQFNNPKFISVGENGIISINHLEELLKNIESDYKIVSVMAVNNETGIIQPLEEVSKLCRKYNALFHVDAVQAIGRIPISISSLNIDLLTISSHKVGGPKGSGCLILRENIKNKFKPLIKGGGQERGFRAGTEAVAEIAGFGKAIELASNMTINNTLDSRNYLEDKLKDNLKDIIIIGENSNRVSNTSAISIKGVSAKKLVIALDMEGFEVSSGSACSSGKVSDSHVLVAMGLDKSIVEGALRISLCEPLSKKIIDHFSDVLCKIVYRFKNYDVR